MLQARNLSKSFPGVTALKGVNLDVGKGQVHAVTGENGAGKSTLMKILAGIHAPDAGEILFKGQPVRFRNPHEALRMYRKQTGINARLIVVGMTATEFTIADPTDPGMLDVVGFDTAAPSLIADFSKSA